MEDPTVTKRGSSLQKLKGSIFFKVSSLLEHSSRRDGMVVYLTWHEVYCLWVGHHFQVIVYTHEDEVI